MRAPNPAGSRHLPLADSFGHEGPVGATESCGEGCGCHSKSVSAEVAAVERELANALMPPAIGGGDDDKLLQVGDVAKVSGKTVRAIHHYEELGLLQPHARSKGRYRLYDTGAVARVRWINKMHDLGLSLPQIQEIVRAWESASSAPSAMAKIRSTYQKKLEETRTQIAHMQSLERELQASIRYLDTCDACDPAEIVQACSSCHVHEREEKQPDLVAGIHGGAQRTLIKAAAAG